MDEALWDPMFKDSAGDAAWKLELFKLLLKIVGTKVGAEAVQAKM